MDLITIVAGYFAVGVVALAILDLLTGRVRGRLKKASWETQNKLVASGSFVGTKMAMVFTVIALLIFWPIAIYGAISSK